MLCKVCNKSIDKHNHEAIEKCLRNGFGVGYSGAHDAIAPFHLVLEQSQESVDKHYYKLRLNDGTFVETYDLAETFAVLLITRLYNRPDEGLVNEPMVMPELRPDQGTEHLDDDGDSEDFGPAA